MAIPALPSNWSSFLPGDKVTWFKNNGVTTYDLLQAGWIQPSEVYWFAERGMGDGSPPPAPVVNQPTTTNTIQQENVYTQPSEPVYEEPVYTPPASSTPSEADINYVVSVTGLPKFVVNQRLFSGESPYDIINSYAQQTSTASVQPTNTTTTSSTTQTATVDPVQNIIDTAVNAYNKTTALNSALAPLQAQWDAEVGNQEQPGIQTDIKSGEISFQGSNWDVFRNPNGSLVIQKLNADQTGMDKDKYRADILNPTTGEVTTQVVNRSSMPTIGRNITLGLIAAGLLAPGLFDLAGTASGTTAGTTTAGTTTGLLGGNSSLAVAGVEGAASQAATTAYANTLAATGNASLAAVAADVASGNVAAGLSVADAVTAGVNTATSGASTGVVTNTGNVVGGGETLTAGTTGSTGLFNGATTGATTGAATGATTGATTGTTTGAATGATTGATTGTTTGAATGATAGATAGGLLSPSTLGTLATGLVNGLTNTNAQNILGGLISSGANLAMVQDAADKLRQQGQLTQTEYTNLAKTLGTDYTTLATKASNMVGEFTPFGVTGSLFNTTYNPATGAVNTVLTEDARAMYNPFAQVAMKSAQAANTTNVDQLTRDYYNKLSALSAPEIERQRLATEARLRAQGRLGVSGSAFGGSSPELLAQEQAIAQQQLQRELQSRQAALGERGTLIGQGAAALAPIQNLTQQQLQQAQLSGQLGQQALQGNIYQTQAFLQPSLAGLQAQGNLQSLGLAGNLQAQQEALAGLLNSRQNVANQVLGNTGSLGSAAGGLLGNLLNPNAAGNINSLGFGTGLGYGNQDIGLFI